MVTNQVARYGAVLRPRFDEVRGVAAVIAKFARSRVSFAAAVGVAACGGAVEPSAPVHPDASVFPPQVDAGTPPSTLGPILDVPEGEAVEGFWYLDSASKTVRPEEKCIDGAPKRFWVAAFRMMKWEVTNGAYRACVSDGACPPPDAPDASTAGNPDTAPWDSPENAKKPVAVSYPAARTFCQHYGGDVVTAAQWDRAAAGDSVSTFGIAPLTSALLQCAFNHQGELCADFAQSANLLGTNLPPFVLREVGTTAWDVGPYGHQDLFANAEEWTRTAQLQPQGTDFCALSDDSPDPIAVSPELANFQTARQIAAVLDVLTSPTPSLVDSQQRPMAVFHVRKVHEPMYFTGFRCAFPR